jgi:hypothetical protein
MKWTDVSCYYLHGCSSAAPLCGTVTAWHRCLYERHCCSYFSSRLQIIYDMRSLHFYSLYFLWSYITNGHLLNCLTRWLLIPTTRIRSCYTREPLKASYGKRFIKLEILYPLLTIHKHTHICELLETTQVKWLVRRG